MKKHISLFLVFALLSSSLIKAGGCLGSMRKVKAKEDDFDQNLKAIIYSSKKGLFKRGGGFWTKPEEEKNESFFNKLTEPKSQREDWYAVTPYIAEFWCTVSNLGFILAGIKHNSPELLFAGSASAVSHAIPLQWLNAFDKVGAAVAFSKAVREYETLLENPELLAPVLLIAGINATDAYLARNKGKTWPHVVWHLSAALFPHIFLQYLKASAVE